MELESFLLAHVCSACSVVHFWVQGHPLCLSTVPFRGLVPKLPGPACFVPVLSIINFLIHLCIKWNIVAIEQTKLTVR